MCPSIKQCPKCSRIVPGYRKATPGCNGLNLGKQLSVENFLCQFYHPACELVLHWYISNQYERRNMGTSYQNCDAKTMK